MIDNILVKRGYLLIDKPSKDAFFYAIELLNKFGVLVDSPKLLSQKNVQVISEFFGVNIPNSFYKNPQHTKYYSIGELLIEQLVSYLKIEYSGENSLDENVFKREEIFKKALPSYEEGQEIKIRKYFLIDKEESVKVLKDIANSYCNYTRPWSIAEQTEMRWLYENKYYDNQYLKCKDNAIFMYKTFKNIKFAEMLDKKDIVKMSISQFGNKKKLKFKKDEIVFYENAMLVAKNCPMSIKQAKYYNALARKVKIDERLNNENSPYKKAINLMKQNEVYKAAQVYASNGALLERNLVYLLSRADLKTADKILELIKAQKTIVLIQLLQGILLDDYSSNRIFKFYYNNRLKSHEETQFEHKFRKSILSNDMKKRLQNLLEDRINQYYKTKDTLGKIYISEEFKNIGLPLNTTAMGMGLDVLPIGSRIKINADYLRTFCYWNDAFDIDASVVFLNKEGKTDVLYWGNYSAKKFGESALTSGDARNKDGAEYCDFRIKELKKLGYTYAMYTINGYCDNLNSGEIYCGYQNKENLDTNVWSPKNIELKINIKGNSRAYLGFAIDFETKEVVILNQVLNSTSRIVNKNDINTIRPYLNKNYLKIFNMYKLLSMRGELVNKPEQADIVFATNYEPKENQTLIRPYNVEKLVELLN